MNRDYHARPNQAGGRSAYDYGHTHLHDDRQCGLGYGAWAVTVLLAVCMIASFV